MNALVRPPLKLMIACSLMRYGLLNHLLHEVDDPFYLAVEGIDVGHDFLEVRHELLCLLIIHLKIDLQSSVPFVLVGESLPQ